ncbi:ABC transporter substrate-binding protein [Sinomonas sp. RB5]
MRTRILAPLVTAAMAGGLLVSVAGPATAASPQPQTVAAAPAAAGPAVAQTPSTSFITQTVTDAAGNVVGTLTGTFTPTQFVNQNGQLAAQGLVTGTLTNATTGATTPVSTTATALVTNAASGGTCNVLSLTLGPLHLDLLGLVVDLNQVNLNITAQNGPGNLLGNLLCSVAGLLDNGSGLQGVLNILNGLLSGL